MTNAQLQKAAFLTRFLPDGEIVTPIEIGSEGAILRIGQPMARGQTWLIARDGSALDRTPPKLTAAERGEPE